MSIKNLLIAIAFKASIKYFSLNYIWPTTSIYIFKII